MLSGNVKIWLYMMGNLFSPLRQVKSEIKKINKLGQNGCDKTEKGVKKLFDRKWSSSP